MRLGSLGARGAGRKQRPIVAGAALLVVMLLLAGRLPETAAAHNDACAPRTGGWYCTWRAPGLAPATPHFFEAAETLRYWIYAAVWDEHGGSVGDKCVHVRRPDTYTEAVACGTGVKDGYTNTWMRPGYLFVRHGASGVRSIGGDGAH